MGIAVSPAKAASYTPEAAGYALVMAHETLAQAVADLITAQAVERQSRAALERIEHLAGTPGAMPADAQEAAARQAAVDHAALALARRRLSATVGQHPPWKDSDQSRCSTALAIGRIKLVRVTFPLGDIDAVHTREPAPGAHRRHSGPARVGNRPAYGRTGGCQRSGRASSPCSRAATPARASGCSPGRRSARPKAGVVIPAAAVVISDGKYWCYVERKPGRLRAQRNRHRHAAGGRLLREQAALPPATGSSPSAAGLLLAREMNPGTAAD